jgi:large subunit ribosomal protein L25
MKLQISKRSAKKKSEANVLRREGFIPAVIYIRGKAAETVAVKSSEFSTLLRHVQPGRLSTHKFTLVDENGKERQAILKEIQYHVTNYAVIHLDFEELHENELINVKVPIECVGANDCPGVKLGGVLRQVIRYLRVRCLPPHIPSAFYLDVKPLGPRESKRLSDLEIPNTIRPLANMGEVAAVIVKR